ncbi:hypothetical protein [Microseira wollei]|nr:hypothetical protein [Microseira wollei]
MIESVQNNLRSLAQTDSQKPGFSKKPGFSNFFDKTIASGIKV